MSEQKYYICHSCKTLGFSDPKCPNCGEVHLEEMCQNDPGVCTCASDIHESIKICPACNQPMCPECGSHSVVGVSRVTGYMQDVSGWNEGKQQELKDRVRTTI